MHKLSNYLNDDRPEREAPLIEEVQNFVKKENVKVEMPEQSTNTNRSLFNFIIAQQKELQELRARIHELEQD